jgi:hypothetical protein
MLVRTLVPDVVASDEVASGMREELAQAGALEPGDGWPRAEVEVLRADRTSEGVAVRGGGPAARASDAAILARAWITLAPGASAERDTGDLRAEDTVAVDEEGAMPDRRSTAFHDADALRASARRLGHKLARRLMGYPTTSEETMDR